VRKAQIPNPKSRFARLMTRRPGFAACASLVLVALVVAAPLWGPGMVNTRGGGDSPFLLQRTHQMLVNLQAGVFPVRWMPDAAYGLGYPFFSYYSALPYYLAGGLALVGVDLLTALKVVQTLGFMAAALAMYGWMRGLTGSRWTAWLAAVAYTVAPFHLVNVYVRGDSLSEFYAFIFYPLILWGLDNLLDRGHPGRRNQVLSEKPGFSPVHPGRIRWVWPGLAYAGLLLSHNISAFIFSPFVLIYLLALTLRERARWHHVLTIGAVALGFGLLLSAWVWVPTLAERGVVQTETLTGGYFHHTHHFRTIDLVQGDWLFNYDTVAGDTPFAMGLPQAAFAVLGGLVLLARLLRGRLGPRWGSVLLGLLVSTAMITPLSKPLWDLVPLLATTQFPWRFLSVQALFAAAATAALVPGLVLRGSRVRGFRRAGSTQPGSEGPEGQGDADRRRSWETGRQGAVSKLLGRRVAWVALPVAALLVASVLYPLRPERLAVGPADVSPQRLQLYELFTQNIGTSIGYEWLPQAVVPRPFTSDALVDPAGAPSEWGLCRGGAPAVPLDGASLEAAVVERRPTRQTWYVWGDGGRIAFPLFYWPGWRAWVDDEPVDVWPVEGSGYLALEALPGEHTILLRLGRTPVRLAAELVSLCAWLGLGVVLVHARHRIRWPSVASHLSFTTLLIVLPLCALSLLSLGPRGTFGGDEDLTMDFDLMPYLHHNPGGVHFADGTLTGYRLSAEELAPGDALTVTLDWTGPVDAYTATVRLLSPAAVRQELEPLAEASCRLQPGVSNPVALRLPDEVSRGTYLLQLSVLGPAREVDAAVPYRAVTPGGKVHGPLYLRPVRVPHGPSLRADSSALAPFGPAIRLHAATVDQLDPHRLAVRLTWSVVRPVAVNYGISLRLLDAEDQRRVALDTQPGYGFLPTSTWRPDELVIDRYILDLPEDLSPGQGYRLAVILYQVSTWEPIGQARLGDLSLPLEKPFEARRPPRVFSLPSLRYPVGVDFGEEVRLAGYDLAREPGVLRLTLWWQALESPQADYTVFVHLFDAATEDILVQSDAIPQGGAYPTSLWTSGEVVSETVTLPLEQLAEGTYRLGVGLYDQTLTRLQAVGADARPVPNGRVILPERVVIEP